MKYPLFKVHVDIPSALKNIKEVLESGFINEGEQVTKFSNKISKWVYGEPILVNACTSALSIALHLLDLKDGDEIITTSQSCIATNTPIANSPAKIVWADINSKTGTLDPKKVEAAITSKTKAVMCMNWGGFPCELGELRRICDKYEIKLIQDAAHSFGAMYDYKPIDYYADFTCFSFQAIKHITTGDGGLLVCKNEEDTKRAKALKWFGIDRDSTKDEQGSWKGQAWDFDVYDPGFKYNMNNLSAALGLSQIEHVYKILMSHVNNGCFYKKYLKTSKIEHLTFPEKASPAYWVYTILTKEGVDRDKVIQKLNDDGIQAGLVHVPNHYYSCFKGNHCDLPETDTFHQRQISLPCGWWLNEEDVKFISSKVNEYVLS